MPGSRPAAATELLTLQRAAGNRAVARLVTRALLQRNGTPKERREKHPVGLAGTGTLADFKAVIDKEISSLNWQDSTIAEYEGAASVRTIHGELNKLLRNIPVPSTALELGGARWGAFSARDWKMRIGIDERSQERIDKNTLKEFLVTLYHESRHAEQAFVEVRHLLTQQPNLTLQQLQAQHRIVIADKAFALAKDMAQQSIGMTTGHQALLDFLHQKEGMATDTEARDYIRKLNKGPVNPQLEATALASASPRDFGAAIVNAAYDRAKKRCRIVKRWIDAYNRVEPRNADDVNDTSGDGLIDPLRRASLAYAQHHGRREEFLKAYWEYLVRRRFQALSEFDAAFRAYSVNNPTESDAHAVETALRHALGVAVGVGQMEIPNPVDWLKAAPVKSAAPVPSSSTGPPPPSSLPPPLPVRPPPPSSLPPPPPRATGPPRQLPVTLPPPPPQFFQ